MKWTSFLNKCYYVSSGINEQKTDWFKAREFCQDNGGDLVSIHSYKELQYIATIVSKIIIK